MTSPFILKRGPPELAKSFGLEKNKGALIAQIQKGSAAEKAGLQEGDIVILFDGKGIDNAADLSRAVASARPDTEHNVKVLREGRKILPTPDSLFGSLHPNGRGLLYRV